MSVDNKTTLDPLKLLDLLKQCSHSDLDEIILRTPGLRLPDLPPNNVPITQRAIAMIQEAKCKGWLLEFSNCVQQFQPLLTQCRQPRVFISYVKEDFTRVEPLYDKLKEQGLNPWIDRVNLLPGVDWDREIVRQIKQSHFVLFCLSHRSLNKRGYVQKELRTALRVFEEIPTGQRYLIPVRLEECEVPDELSKYHFADIFRAGEFDKLLKSIFTSWDKLTRPS